MVTRRCLASVLTGSLLLAGPSDAATVRGAVSDATGGLLSGAHVIMRGLATGQESSVETSDEGRFEFEGAAPGTYLIIVTRAGFSEAARTVVDRRADADARSAGAARGRRPERRGQRHRRPRGARDPPDSASRRNASPGRHRADEHALDRRRA